MYLLHFQAFQHQFSVPEPCWSQHSGPCPPCLQDRDHSTTFFPNLFYVASKYTVSQNCFCKCMKVSIPAWIGPIASLRWAGRFDPAVCKCDLQEGELLHPWFVLVSSVWRKVGHLSDAFESHGAIAGFWIQCQQHRQCLWAVSQTGTLCAVEVLWQAGQSQRVCLLWEMQHI